MLGPVLAIRLGWWRRPGVIRAAPAAVLLGFGLVVLVHNPPLWYDEAYSRLTATVPLSALLSGVWHRTGVISYLMDVPPSFNAPYYVLLHAWCSVAGTSEFALRLPSVLSAAAAVAVLAELVRRQAGPGAGLVCGLLCAAGPLLVDEATQARDYGPALLALALCALWFVEWLDTGGGRGLRRIAVAAALAGLLHWFTLPVLAGFALAALLRRGRRGLGAALTLAAATVPAGLLVGWSLAGGTYGAPSPAPVGWWLPVDAVRDWSLGSSWVCTGLSVGLTAAAVIGVRPGQPAGRRVLVACWVLVPMALITAVELIRPTYFPRYLLFTLIGLVIAAALGVASLRSGSRSLRWAVARYVAAVALVALSVAATVPRLNLGAREPSPATVTLLAARQQPGEPIVPADGRTTVDLLTYLTLAPRLRTDLVLPPELFTTQTSSRVVWLVRVVLKQNSLPIVPAEQRLIDAGWTEQGSSLLVGSDTDLRVERWTR